jgi:hypothetical protein
MDTPRGQVSARVGRGRREVTGQVRFEFDRLDEWFEWRNTKQLSMKFFQEGPVIDETAGTNKEAEIIIPRAYWNTYTPDERGSNLTATFAFRAYLHATEPIWSVRSKIALPTLP